MNDNATADTFPGLTDIHAHPAMNAFLWDRDLRRHYWTGHTFDLWPASAIQDAGEGRGQGAVVVAAYCGAPKAAAPTAAFIRLPRTFSAAGSKLLKLNAWECLLVMMAEMERQVARGGKPL